MRISDWSSDVCSSDLPPDAVDPMLALDQTRAYWDNWISGTCYHGPHRDPVIRSLLTLKALIHTPTGGIVAAPTASLPERRGGNRNRDYRYSWLRDSTFTMLALLQIGREHVSTPVTNDTP